MYEMSNEGINCQITCQDYMFRGDPSKRRSTEPSIIVLRQIYRHRVCSLVMQARILPKHRMRHHRPVHQATPVDGARLAVFHLISAKTWSAGRHSSTMQCTCALYVLAFDLELQTPKYLIKRRRIFCLIDWSVDWLVAVANILICYKCRR